MQFPDPVTVTGDCAWTLDLTIYQGCSSSPLDCSGNVFVVARDATSSSDGGVNGVDPLGPGWGISGIDQLFPAQDSAGNPGLEWVTGAGATRFFGNPAPYDPSKTYISPPGDFGTLVQGPDDNYIYTGTNGWRTVFTEIDGRYLQTAVIDPHNLTTTYTYNPSTWLTGITTMDGSTTSFTYSGGVITSISEPSGRTVSLSHDGSGDLTTITAAAGDTRTLSYDGCHRVTVDQWSPYNTSFSYNTGSGLLSGVTLGVGLGSNYTIVSAAQAELPPGGDELYPATGTHTATLTDPLGNTTTYTLDLQFRLIGESQEIGTATATQTWVLNPAGQITSYTDAMGNVTTYQYYVNGDLAETVNPNYSASVYLYSFPADSHQVIDEFDFSGDGLMATTVSAYDSTADLLSTTDPDGYQTNYVYFSGASAGLVETETDPDGNQTQYGYDSHRRLTNETDPYNPETVESITTISYVTSSSNLSVTTDVEGSLTTTTYNGDDQVISDTDADGNETLYQYYPAGQVEETEDPDGFWTFDFLDQRGYETETIVDAGQPNEQVTENTFDPAGNIVKTVDPDGDATEYTYNQVGEQLSQTDSLGNTTESEFDLNGNVTASIDAEGNETKYTIDNMGDQTAVTDPLGRVSRTIYNGFGNDVVSIDPAGNETVTAYNLDNQEVSTTDPMGDTTYSIEDADGNVTETIDPLGYKSLMQYNGDNQLISETDADGNVTKYTYDDRGNQATITSPDGGVSAEKGTP